MSILLPVDDLPPEFTYPPEFILVLRGRQVEMLENGASLVGDDTAYGLDDQW